MEGRAGGRGRGKMTMRNEEREGRVSAALLCAREREREEGTHVCLCDELVERVRAPLLVHALRGEHLARELDLALVLLLLLLLPCGGAGQGRRPPRAGEQLELVARSGRVEREGRDRGRDGDLARGWVGLALVVLVPDAHDGFGRGRGEGLAEGDCGAEG